LFDVENENLFETTLFDKNELINFGGEGFVC